MLFTNFIIKTVNRVLMHNYTHGIDIIDSWDKYYKSVGECCNGISLYMRDIFVNCIECQYVRLRFKKNDIRNRKLGLVVSIGFPIRRFWSTHHHIYMSIEEKYFEILLVAYIFYHYNSFIDYKFFKFCVIF